MKPIRNNAANLLGLSVKSFCPFLIALMARTEKNTRAHSRNLKLTNTVAGTVESLKNMELQDVKRTMVKTAAFGFIAFALFMLMIFLRLLVDVVIISSVPTAVSIG